MILDHGILVTITRREQQEYYTPNREQPPLLYDIFLMCCACLPLDTKDHVFICRKFFTPFLQASWDPNFFFISITQYKYDFLKKMDCNVIMLFSLSKNYSVASWFFLVKQN